MLLRLQGAYLHYFPELRAYLERRLERALQGFRQPVVLATLYLSGSPPWRCRVRLRLRGAEPISVEAVRALPSDAVDAALERLAATFPDRTHHKGGI